MHGLSLQEPVSWPQQLKLAITPRSTNDFMSQMYFFQVPFFPSVFKNDFIM